MVVTECGSFCSWLVIGRVVDGTRGTMQESLGAAAVGHEESDRLGVGPEVLIPPAALGHRQVDDVVEVGRNPGVVAVGQVDGFAPHAGLLEALTRSAVGEAGDAPYLVIGCEGRGDGPGDLPGRTRDQYFEAAHAVIVSEQATTTASR